MEESRLGKTKMGDVPEVLLVEFARFLESVNELMSGILHMRDCEKHDTEVALNFATDLTEGMTEMTLAFRKIADGMPAEQIADDLEAWGNGLDARFGGQEGWDN